MNRVLGRLRSMVPFWRWPLTSLKDHVDLSPPNDGLDRHVRSSRFSLRLQRYWWAGQKLAELADQHAGTLVVADLGCERGWLKRFTPYRPNILWHGLDGDTSKPSLQASNYDRLTECDFNRALPLDDRSVDVVVSLHVFEHLADPAFTMNEIARVLRPGGCFLGGSPTSPGPLSMVRTQWLRIRHRLGRNRHWGHLQKLSPGAWDSLARQAGLSSEFITGSHLVRLDHNRIEDRPWWVRLNQLWGAIWPSLGQEVYLSLRKPTQGSTPPAQIGSRLWLRLDWLTPVGVAAAIWLAFTMIPTNRVGLHDEIAWHQDGNDVFAFCPMIDPDVVQTLGDVGTLPSGGSLASTFSRYSSAGKDLHLIVCADTLPSYLDHEMSQAFRLADVWDDAGRRYLVLSLEAKEPSLIEAKRSLDPRQNSDHRTIRIPATIATNSPSTSVYSARM